MDKSQLREVLILMAGQATQLLLLIACFINMSNNKKTVVLGASPNITRVSNQVVHRLQNGGFDVVPVGIRDGAIAGIDIQKGQPDLEGVDTITLYLSAKNQMQYYDYILGLKPNRLIFNPGAENIELYQMARERGIKVENACTLVMLSVGIY